MKKCTDCKYAKWDKTKTGRLHPSGGGYCTKEVKQPKLPASKYYFGRNLIINGGFINRREELKEHCVYYSEK